jgi:hypothetical protein
VWQNEGSIDHNQYVNFCKLMIDDPSFLLARCFTHNHRPAADKQTSGRQQPLVLSWMNMMMLAFCGEFDPV